MINASPEVRSALLSLSRNTNSFKTVTEWMQANLNKGACDLINARGEDVPRLQRECQIWDMLINYFDRVDEDDINRLHSQLAPNFTLPNTRSRIGQCDDADSETAIVNTPQGTHNT